MANLPETIKHPDAFARTLPFGFDGVFDWSFLLPIFEGTKITPTDIDGLVERFGHILIFETKPPDKEVPPGQRIALERLVALGRGNIRVIVLYGKTPLTIVGCDEWYYARGQLCKTGKRECDHNYVFRRVKAWFEEANNNELCWPII